MTILVVEDDLALRNALRRSLLLAGYDAVGVADGQQALDMVEASHPDAVVLDVGLPHVDGLEVTRRLRAAGDRTPILMLTARDQISDRIAGLDAGADDYLVKPFDVGELKARVRALLRRRVETGEVTAADPTFADLRLDSGRHGVTFDEHFVELTRTEFSLMELLLNPRQVLTPSIIYDRVWDYDFGPTSNSLRVYIGYLRRKLEQIGAPALIHTVRGVGYVLREP